MNNENNNNTDKKVVIEGNENGSTVAPAAPATEPKAEPANVWKTVGFWTAIGAGAVALGAAAYYGVKLATGDTAGANEAAETASDAADAVAEFFGR